MFLNVVLAVQHPLPSYLLVGKRLPALLAKSPCPESLNWEVLAVSLFPFVLVSQVLRVVPLRKPRSYYPTQYSEEAGCSGHYYGNDLIWHLFAQFSSIKIVSPTGLRGFIYERGFRSLEEEWGASHEFGPFSC